MFCGKLAARYLSILCFWYCIFDVVFDYLDNVKVKGLVVSIGLLNNRIKCFMEYLLGFCLMLVPAWFLKCICIAVFVWYCIKSIGIDATKFLVWLPVFGLV